MPPEVASSRPNNRRTVTVMKDDSVGCRNVARHAGIEGTIVPRVLRGHGHLYWWGSVLDESEPLKEHLSRPRLSRVSQATQTVGPVEDEWLRENLVAIAQLAESLDRASLELAFQIVPLDWWATQLPDRPPTAENVLAWTPTDLGVGTRP